MNTRPDESPAAAADSESRAAEVEEFQVVCPAAAGAVPVVRAFVRAVAGHFGARLGEVELVASELASCAVRGTAGGVFTVTARRAPGRLRVAVTMRGSGWWPVGSLDGDGADAVVYACGLALVAVIADRFGHEGAVGGTAVLWAEMSAAADDRDAREPL